jgi:putative CocE/NonD family hydrolase
MLPIESIKVEVNVPIRMRDGTILYGDVFRPEGRVQYPAILTRLPYNKNVEFPTASGYMNPMAYARAGYAVVIQDVRGTGASEGQAFFWHQEYDDGYDSVEWVAAQPWCNGNVGMYGYSYSGHTQFAAAVTQPPHLKAICPGFTVNVPRYFVFSLRGDKFKLMLELSWCLTISSLGLLRIKNSHQKTKAVADKLMYLTDDIKEQCRFLPMKDAPVVKMIDELGMRPSYCEILAHKDDHEFWKEICDLSPLEKITVPAFHFSGWYDVDLTPAVINSYLGIKERSRSALARQNQKLIIGPWVHNAYMLNKVGELDFGMLASGAVIDMAGMHLRWFDYWLKGVDNGVKDEPPVRIFVMGANVWRNENEWPLARTKYTKYYFHSCGQANSRYGDGLLSFRLPDDEPFDSYIYDPRNPVPSHEMGMGAYDQGMGAYDQQEVEIRTDILVYTSEPLKADLEVTGPVEVILCAASSAVDTDFTGKLADVWPDGKAYNVAEGIIRAGYRESGIAMKPIKPGEVYEYSIGLGATSNVFKVGHRIRVEISSSNFPKWDRNLNTGHPLGQDAEIQLAMQTIYHNRRFASHILLPVIPR